MCGIVDIVTISFPFLSTNHWHKGGLGSGKSLQPWLALLLSSRYDVSGWLPPSQDTKEGKKLRSHNLLGGRAHFQWANHFPHGSLSFQYFHCLGDPVTCGPLGGSSDTVYHSCYNHFMPPFDGVIRFVFSVCVCGGVVTKEQWISQVASSLGNTSTEWGVGWELGWLLRIWKEMGRGNYKPGW